MADGTYQVKVYEKQGGAELVVASSGYITVESGGQIDVESGGQIDVESGGHIDIEDGGYIALPSATETTAAALDTFGLSVLATTKEKRLYVLGAPAAGREKFITATVSGATAYASVSSTAAGAAFSVTATTSNQLRFVGIGTVHLIGKSTSRWAVVSKSTTVSGQASH